MILFQLKRFYSNILEPVQKSTKKRIKNLKIALEWAITNEN